MQKVEGNITFHTALSTSVALPAPGAAASPAPMLVPADRLRSMLGIANLTFSQNQTRLAIIDNPLQAPVSAPPEDPPARPVPETKRAAPPTPEPNGHRELRQLPL
jgi:hypothetical protein